jgi:hypothetical protein
VNPECKHYGRKGKIVLKQTKATGRYTVLFFGKSNRRGMSPDTKASFHMRSLRVAYMYFFGLPYEEDISLEQQLLDCILQQAARRFDRVQKRAARL